jgi:hypothetical protein
VSDDLKTARAALRERMRESGVDRRRAEQLAEASVRRVADRKDRDTLTRKK